MTKLQHVLWTLVVAFAATVVSLMLTKGADVFTLTTWASWHPYLAAGVTAVLVVVARYFMSADKAFGVGSTTATATILGAKPIYPPSPPLV